MEKEQYLKMRQNNSFDMKFFYQFYTEKNKCKEILDFNTFSKAFTAFLQFNSGTVISTLDSYFEVTVLMDEKGKELKIY